MRHSVRFDFPVMSRSEAWQVMAWIEAALARGNPQFHPAGWRGGDERLHYRRERLVDLELELGESWTDPDPAFVQSVVHVGDGVWTIAATLHRSKSRTRNQVSASFASHERTVVDREAQALRQQAQGSGIEHRATDQPAGEPGTASAEDRTDPRTAAIDRPRIAEFDRDPATRTETARRSRSRSAGEYISEHLIQIVVGAAATVLGAILVAALNIGSTR